MMWTLLLFFLKPSPTLTCQQQQGLNKEVVRYDVDSLEAIRIEEFNVSQTSTPKEKKSTRGRPRKFSQGELLNTENTNQVYSGNSSQIAHTPKKNMETYCC